MAAMKRMKVGKAVGPDDIQEEAKRAFGKPGSKCLTNIWEDY